MDDMTEILRRVVRESGTSQSELSRLTGVRQGRISQYLSGALTPSARQLEKLITPLGFTVRLVVTEAEPEAGSRAEQRHRGRRLADLLGVVDAMPPTRTRHRASPPPWRELVRRRPGLPQRVPQ